jgi:hypothetical protein
MEEVLIKAAANQGLWALLAVVLIVYILHDSREREKRLMTHLEKSNESLEKISSTIDKMDMRLNLIENKVINKRSE